MPEELQSLLNKINEEGVRKAEAERASIIAAAENDARTIREKAQAEAEEIKKAAESEAEALTARTESAVRQAARDIILELQSELELRIRRAVEGAAEQALSADFMAGLIRELAAKFAAAPGSAISVLTAVKDVPALENALRGALASSLHTDPQVFGSTGIKGGLEVSFRDGEVYFDFTSGAVTELVGEYIGPRLAKLLAGDDK